MFILAQEIIFPIFLLIFCLNRILRLIRFSHRYFFRYLTKTEELVFSSWVWTRSSVHEFLTQLKFFYLFLNQRYLPLSLIRSKICAYFSMFLKLRLCLDSRTLRIFHFLSIPHLLFFNRPLVRRGKKAKIHLLSLFSFLSFFSNSFFLLSFSIFIYITVDTSKDHQCFIL